MKKLEELGISPTPWRTVDGFGRKFVVDKNGKIVSSDCKKDENAFIISAASELYKALWFQCFGNTGVGNCRNCKGAELGNCKTCPLGNARAALAKASGEGEV